MDRPNLGEKNSITTRLVVPKREGKNDNVKLANTVKCVQRVLGENGANLGYSLGRTNAPVPFAA